MPRKVRNQFLFASFILAAFFVYLSFLVGQDTFRTADYEIMVNLQKAVSNTFDVPFSYLTLAGSSEISLIILGVVFMGVLVLKRRLFLGLFLYFFIYLVELWGKLFIYHPEPPEIFARYALGFHFPSSFIVHTGFSFPSGHMARTSFLAVIILFLLRNVVGGRHRRILGSILLVLFIVGVFISRVYLGEHWISDVLGGFFLGASLASLSISFW